MRIVTVFFTISYPTPSHDFTQMGLIAISAVDQQPKIKIYRDNDGRCKGDCALCYYAESSLDMALEVLHEGYIRPGFQITVKKAEFQASSAEDGPQTQNQNQNQFKKSRPKLSQAQVKVAQSVMRQGVTWSEDDDMGLSKSKALKIVVLEGEVRINKLYYLFCFCFFLIQFHFLEFLRFSVGAYIHLAPITYDRDIFSDLT
jgi:hypothetical protein